MPTLIPIIYNKKEYPRTIKSSIYEVAGHFDVKKLIIKGYYSLHTEYSYGARKYNSDIIRPYLSLREANIRGVPQLWFSKQWSEEFAEFIIELTSNCDAPSIIEIHPPFSDYSNLETFIENYTLFNSLIKQQFSDTRFFIENRCGSVYHGGSFIISKINHLLELSSEIDRLSVDLKITLDIPQLFTAHNITPTNADTVEELFKNIKKIRHNICGIHLWGKRKNPTGRPIAHNGDLNSYFDNDMEFKDRFLYLLYNAFDDEVSRFFVPEVNGKLDDLHAIVHDLEESGFTFI